MINGLLYKWFHPRSVAGVTVQLGAAASTYGFDWIVLEQQKGKATIKGKGQLIGSPEDLKAALPADTTLALSVVGKGVLVRKVSQAKAEHPETLAQELLPGAKAADYYFDMIPASLGQVMVAMVRRTVVDALLQEIEGQGIKVLSISIGPLAATTIAPLFEVGGTEKQLDIAGYSLKFNQDDVPEHVERTTNTTEYAYPVAGEQLKATEVLPFASALGFWLLPNQELISKEPSGQGYEEYLHEKMFQVGIKAVLGVFLIVLMINFVLFNQQYQLNTELKQLLGNKQERLQYFEALKIDYDQNLAFLGGEGWLKPAKVSFYADEIAATVPNEIVLTQMEIYPDTMSRKNSKDRSRYNTSGMLLTGQVNSSVLLQQWATNLREIAWVQTVTVKNYSQEDPSELGVFDMIVEMKQ